MDVHRVRKLVTRGKVTPRFTDHAVIEARKDGLTAEDLENAVAEGKLIEDYGERGLLLSFTKDDGRPCHIVLEYAASTEEAAIVTAYVPDAKEWEPNWTKRRRRKQR